jgi:hypothetical protein
MYNQVDRSVGAFISSYMHKIAHNSYKDSKVLDQTGLW